MEKVYLKNGKEVKIGDTLILTYRSESSIFGGATMIKSIIVTVDNLPKLIEAGIVTTKPTESAKSTVAETKVPMELEYYIQKIADRLGWKLEKMYNYLNTIDVILPAAALSLILKEIAVELDKKYKDHIQNSPEIFAISMLNGRIGRINKANIKNYKNFAAFRSIEDAKIACFIVRDILKEMFKDTSGK